MKSETWKRFQEASTKLLPRLALLAALATWFFGFFLQKVVPQEMAVHGLIVALFVTLWFMLVSTQSTQEASEATRDTLIPSESQHLLQNVSTIHLFGFSRRDDIFSSAKELKMAAINFFGLKEYRSLLTTCAVENKTEI